MAAKKKPVAVDGLDRQIEMRDVSALSEYADNARTHSAKQIRQIVASIEQFGWTNPLLVDDAGTVIAGHGRLAAARKMGLAQVPCLTVAGLSDDKRRALVLADNQIALNSGWNEDTLARELQALVSGNFEVKTLGFADRDLGELLAKQLAGKQSGEGGDGDGPPGDDKDAKAEPITQTGDLWVLGTHRLLCGDSTDPDAVAELMEGETAALMCTDPPYGVSHVAVKAGIPRSGFKDIDKTYDHIANDDLTDDKLREFLERIFAAATPALAANAAWYIWHASGPLAFFVHQAMVNMGVLVHRQIIWAKAGFVLTRSGMYHWSHEPCWFGWREGKTPPWYGEKNQRSVWNVGHDSGKSIHPTQKPVALWEPPILNHTLPGQVIYEPFAGSGGQLICAENHQRRCHAIELSPRYCDGIVQRWQAHTGQTAYHLASGQSFADRAAAAGVKLQADKPPAKPKAKASTAKPAAKRKAAAKPQAKPKPATRRKPTTKATEQGAANG